MALAWFWFYLGHFGEGRAWLERAVAVDDVPPDPRTAALVHAAFFAHIQGDLPRAVMLAEAGLTLAEACGALPYASYAQTILGLVADEEADYDLAGPRYEAALALALTAGDPFWDRFRDGDGRRRRPGSR